MYLKFHNEIHEVGWPISRLIEPVYYDISSSTDFKQLQQWRDYREIRGL